MPSFEQDGRFALTEGESEFPTLWRGLIAAHSPEIKGLQRTGGKSTGREIIRGEFWESNQVGPDEYFVKRGGYYINEWHGGSDYMRVEFKPYKSSIEELSGTISCWANMPSATKTDNSAHSMAEIVDNSSANDMIGIRKTTANEIVFRYRAGATNHEAGGSGAWLGPSNQRILWHYAFVWKVDRSMLCYLNGKEVASFTRGGDISAGTLDTIAVGSTWPGAAIGWTGHLGCGLYYNRALNPAEIKILARNRMGPFTRGYASADRRFKVGVAAGGLIPVAMHSYRQLRV